MKVAELTKYNFWISFIDVVWYRFSLLCENDALMFLHLPTRAHLYLQDNSKCVEMLCVVHHHHTTNRQRFQPVYRLQNSTLK